MCIPYVACHSVPAHTDSCLLFVPLPPHASALLFPGSSRPSAEAFTAIATGGRRAPLTCTKIVDYGHYLLDGEIMLSRRYRRLLRPGNISHHAELATLALRLHRTTGGEKDAADLYEDCRLWTLSAGRRNLILPSFIIGDSWRHFLLTSRSPTVLFFSILWFSSSASYSNTGELQPRGL